MDFSFLLNDIASWREGHVMNDIVFNLGCCCPSQGTEKVFSYIEVVYQNGNRHYFYENEAGFSGMHVADPAAGEARRFCHCNRGAAYGP